MSGWHPIDTRPRSQRVLVCGGPRHEGDGYADVQGAWIDSFGNVWLDDRKEGASPSYPTHWQALPETVPGEPAT